MIPDRMVKFLSAFNVTNYLPRLSDFAVAKLEPSFRALIVSIFKILSHSTLIAVLKRFCL